MKTKHLADMVRSDANTGYLGHFKSKDYLEKGHNEFSDENSVPVTNDYDYGDTSEPTSDPRKSEAEEEKSETKAKEKKSPKQVKYKSPEDTGLEPNQSQGQALASDLMKA